MSAKVAFLSRPIEREEQKPLTAINPGAIVTRNGKHFVFLIQDNRVVQTSIKPGITIGDMIEVLDGVKHDDKIAVKPVNKLRDGSKIKVKNER